MKGRIPEGETLSREHLSNERTLLSWVRTGINAIGVGILVYAVADYVDVLSDTSGTLSTLDSGTGGFAFFGIGMVVFGVLLEVIAVARFVQYKTSLERGTFTSSALVYLLLILGLVLLSVAYISYVVIG